MKIEKAVRMPINCIGCKCQSFMNRLKLRKLPNGMYLLKGRCVACDNKYNNKLDEVDFRNLKIQIILDSE